MLAYELKVVREHAAWAVAQIALYDRTASRESAERCCRKSTPDVLVTEDAAP